MNLSEEQVSRRRMSRVIEKTGADWEHPIVHVSRLSSTCLCLLMVESQPQQNVKCPSSLNCAAHTAQELRLVRMRAVHSARLQVNEAMIREAVTK